MVLKVGRSLASRLPHPHQHRPGSLTHGPKAKTSWVVFKQFVSTDVFHFSLLFDATLCSSRFSTITVSQFVTMTSSAFNIKECTVKCSPIIELNHRKPNYLQPIFLTVSHPAYGEIAKLSGWFIIRDCIRGEFFQVMNSKSEDLHRLSVTLFDRFGNVRPWIVHDDYHKGLGTWGEELNDGRLVHIKDIKVKDEVCLQSNLAFISIG